MGFVDTRQLLLHMKREQKNGLAKEEVHSTKNEWQQLHRLWFEVDRQLFKCLKSLYDEPHIEVVIVTAASSKWFFQTLDGLAMTQDLIMKHGTRVIASDGHPMCTMDDSAMFKTKVFDMVHKQCIEKQTSQPFDDGKIPEKTTVELVVVGDSVAEHVAADLCSSTAQHIWFLPDACFCLHAKQLMLFCTILQRISEVTAVSKDSWWLTINNEKQIPSDETHKSVTMEVETSQPLSHSSHSAADCRHCQIVQ